MAYSSTSLSMIPDLSDNRVSDVADPSMLIVQPALAQDNRTSLDGPVAILWDIENCPVPSDVRPEDVGGNIRMALRVHPVIKGAVTTFSAYGDFNSFPRRLREGCQRTGVKLIDVPNGRKDAADKAILIDMFLFALDNPPPSSILLISGDVDFAPALHILGQRGYTIILVIPSGVGVSSALTNAGKYVWDWQSVARGEGFVHPANSRGGSADKTAYFMGCHRTDSINNQNDDEAIVYRGISQSYYNWRDFSVISQSLQEYNCSSSMFASALPLGIRSQSLPPFMNEVSPAPVSCDDQYHLPLRVQPGDINGLKVQLVQLLEQSGGCLPLNRIPAEYQKIYGRQLSVSEYGAVKLVDLFKKIGDAIFVEGKGQKRSVCLKNWKAGTNAPPVILRRKDKKGKGFYEESVDSIVVGGSSEEISDEERAVVDENDEKGSQEKNEQSEVAQNEVDDQTLEQFKYELQEILVSHSCRMFLGSFETKYQQRYKKPLDYQKFGVDQVEDLFDKLRDVVVLLEEPNSRKKILMAVGG